MRLVTSWLVRHLFGNALYLGYIGFFVYFWLFANDAFAATWQSRAYDLVTLEFISLFVAAFFVPSLGKRSLFAALRVITGVGLVWAVFLLGVVEIAGWWAGAYFIGTNLAKTLNGHDIGAALTQLAWLMLSGFGVAFFSSMAGVDADAIFETNRASLALWWISYYAGLIAIDLGAFRVIELPETENEAENETDTSSSPGRESRDKHVASKTRPSTTDSPDRAVSDSEASTPAPTDSDDAASSSASSASARNDDTNL